MCLWLTQSPCFRSLDLVLTWLREEYECRLTSLELYLARDPIVSCAKEAMYVVRDLRMV